MDQLSGFGKHPDGTSGSERGVRGERATSEMAGAAAGGGGVERRKDSYSGRVARILGGNVCEVATAGCVCVRRGDSADERGEIQEVGAAGAVCGLEVGVGRCDAAGIGGP